MTDVRREVSAGATRHQRGGGSGDRLLALAILSTLNRAARADEIISPPDRVEAAQLASELVVRRVEVIRRPGASAEWLNILQQPFSPRRLPGIVVVNVGGVEHRFDRQGQRVTWKGSTVRSAARTVSYSPSAGGDVIMSVRTTNRGGSDTTRRYVGRPGQRAARVDTAVLYRRTGTTVSYDAGERSPEVVDRLGRPRPARRARAKARPTRVKVRPTRVNARR